MQIQIVNPKDLHEHPLLKALPPLAKDDPDLLKISDSVQEIGRITDPIKITKDGRLVDGRKRRLAAIMQQVDLPAIEVSDEDAATLIISSLEARTHYTKAQRAFLLVPFMEEAFAEARKRQLTGVKGNLLHSVQKVRTPEDHAREMGVSYRVLMQAKELRDLFAKHPEKRTLTDRAGVSEKGVTFEEFFTPRLLMHEDPENAESTRPYGLGAALTGIKTHLAQEKHPHKKTGGKPKKIEKQLDLFKEAFSSLGKRYKYWAAWDPETKKEGSAAIIPAIERMPDDLLATLHKTVGTELKRRKKTTKTS